MARLSLERLKAAPPAVDRAKIAATTEEDVRRQMVEDGEDPDAEPSGYRPAVSVTALRERLSMTQAVFARAIGVPVATVRNWEQGRKEPDPAARSLLTIIDREPEAALRALGAAR